MIDATPAQREQIHDFFVLMNDHLDDVVLYPVIDKRTGEERLAVCLVREDEGEHSLYMLGLWLLPGTDSLFDQMTFKEEDSPVVTRRENFFVRLFNKLKGSK